MLKNFFHGIASLLFVAWFVALAADDAVKGMHYLLIGSIISGAVTIALYRSAATKRKP